MWLPGGSGRHLIFGALAILGGLNRVHSSHEIDQLSDGPEALHYSTYSTRRIRLDSRDKPPVIRNPNRRSGREEDFEEDDFLEEDELLEDDDYFDEQPPQRRPPLRGALLGLFLGIALSVGAIFTAASVGRAGSLGSSGFNI